VSPEIQLDRLTKRDAIDQMSAARKIKAQMPLAVKRKRATTCISNDGSRQELATQV
jgi:dephospho-CoA kinase